MADWPAAWAALPAGLGLGDQPAAGDTVRVTVPGAPHLDGAVDFVNSQALGIRTADGLLRFIQGYIGSFVLSHRQFADPDVISHNDKQTSQALTTWLAGL